MSFEFSRNVRDANFEKSAALAQAGANSPTIDLEQAVGGDIETIVGQIELPAVAGIADAKSLSFQLYDSADGSNWAAVDPAITTKVTASGGAGTAAGDKRFRFPPITRRYVRIQQTADASAGTFSGSFIFRLLF